MHCNSLVAHIRCLFKTFLPVLWRSSRPSPATIPRIVHPTGTRLPLVVEAADYIVELSWFFGILGTVEFVPSLGAAV